MRVNPLLGLTGYFEKRLKIIETELSAFAPRAGLILERTGERRCEEGTLPAGCSPRLSL